MFAVGLTWDVEVLLLLRSITFRYCGFMPNMSQPLVIDWFGLRRSRISYEQTLVFLFFDLLFGHHGLLFILLSLSIF